MRIRVAMLDIVAPGFVSPELIVLARAGIDQHLQEHTAVAEEHRDG